MTTHSGAPTSRWNLPLARPGAVVLGIVALVALGWPVLSPFPDATLAAADVDGPWPFAQAEVDVVCRGGGAIVDLASGPYALSTSLRAAGDLYTFDLDTSDAVWLRGGDGAKVPLQPAREAAEAVCS